jgi:DNA gyrase/topoisomerase IV subunit A
VNPLQEELNEMKAQKEKLERELLAREELMQSMFSLLAEKKKKITFLFQHFFVS